MTTQPSSTELTFEDVEFSNVIDYATATESIIDTVSLNVEYFNELTTVMISAGNILDQIKKHTFYGKEFDLGKLLQLSQQLQTAADNIAQNPLAVADQSTYEHCAIDPRVFHAVTGSTTESVELLENMDVKGGTFDTVNFLEEMFDLVWYVCIGHAAVGGSIKRTCTNGLKKLEARFKGKFDRFRAINRDLKTERQILDNMID